MFDAETSVGHALLKQETTSARERLTRLLGLWDGDTNFRLPNRLPALPGRPLQQPFIEVDAVTHRIDLQIARIELGALAKSLELTQASRFVTMLQIAGIDRKTRDPDTPPFRERGFDHQFQIPIFDGGEVRVGQATETYNKASHRLTGQAVNARPDGRAEQIGSERGSPSHAPPTDVQVPRSNSQTPRRFANAT